jgi:hypothetical protein
MNQTAYNIVSNAQCAISFTDHTAVFVAKLDKAIEETNNHFTVEGFNSKNKNRWCIRVVDINDGNRHLTTGFYSEEAMNKVIDLIQERRKLRFS